MNLFQRKKGFDSIIAKGVGVQGTLFVPANQVLIFDGDFDGDSIVSSSDTDGNGQLILNGRIASNSVIADNLIITGNVTIDGDLTVRKSLSIEGNAVVKATRIVYSKLQIGVNARVQGQLVPMDVADEA
jgi:cytoskeletal protein CcmA (bactofilin family)